MLRALSVATLLVSLCVAAPSSAQVQVQSAHTKARTYSAALRYLRIDLGYEVLERDPDAAYLMFAFTVRGEKEKRTGSIEIVETDRGVVVEVSIPRFPEQEERRISDGLLEKMRRELGKPPEREPPAKGGAGDEKRRPPAKQPPAKQPPVQDPDQSEGDPFVDESLPEP